VAQALFARAGLDPDRVIRAPEHEVLALIRAISRTGPAPSLSMAVAATPPGVTTKRFVNVKAKRRKP